MADGAEAGGAEQGAGGCAALPPYAALTTTALLWSGNWIAGRWLAGSG